jgi:GTPase SAR1 family protein
VSISTQSGVYTIPIRFFPPIVLASSLLRFIVSDDILSCRAMDGQHMRNGEGSILLYSIISREPFEETNQFYQQIVQIKGRGNLSMVLVGNKRDLEHERQVGVNGDR